MRTNLTLDDDLADLLRLRARELGRPFREVVNLTLRRGLGAEGAVASRPEVKTMPFDSGLRTGSDPDRMNQLADELEVEPVREKLAAEGGANDPA